MQEGGDMRRSLVWVIGVSLLAGAFSLAQEPIKIGCLLELTGACAAYGQMAREALEFAREAGIVPTEVRGRPVQLVYFDARTNPVEAANGAIYLIQVEKVVAIIGPMSSVVYLGAAEIAQEAGVPIISPTATSPLITQVGDYCFRACFKADDQGPIAAMLAHEVLGAKTACVLVDSDQPYCVELGRGFVWAFEGLGGKVLKVMYCHTGDVAFTSQLTEFAKLNPDIIYTPNYYTEVALMARDARNLGLTQPILGADTLHAPELIQIGGTAVEGIMFTALWHEEFAITWLAQKYIQAYWAKYGRAPDAFGALAVDSYLLLVDAIHRAWSTDPKAIRDALATADLEVVTGHMIMTGEGTPMKDFVFLKVEGGKFKVLDIWVEFTQGRSKEIACTLACLCCDFAPPSSKQACCPVCDICVVK
jgi:branched-chain amino acid transport system substrate-binding protein